MNLLKAKRKGVRVAGVKILLLTVCLLALCACSVADSDAEASPTQITQSFFEAFETADYEAMKAYCTEDSIELYFRDNSVFGMVWAKAANIELATLNLVDSEYVVLVEVEMETAETSALYPETETGFYVLFKQMEDGSLLIDGFITG